MFYSGFLSWCGRPGAGSTGSRARADRRGGDAGRPPHRGGPLLGLGVAAVALLGLAGPGHADVLRVGVATNFTRTAEQLGRQWEARTGHTVRFAFASTGSLYHQIRQGAPFDAFLAADTDRPRLLVEAGAAPEATLFVYATGRIALYSRTLPVAEAGPELIRAMDYRHLAIATPKTAPYGRAARQVLEGLGVYRSLERSGKLVQGSSIAAAFQYVATGNAELGFIALAQLLDPSSPVRDVGQSWLPPAGSYDPIAQGAVVLARSPRPDLAAAFLDYLREDPEAHDIIQSYGYGVPGAD